MKTEVKRERVSRTGYAVLYTNPENLITISNTYMCVCVCSVTLCVQLFVTLWTIDHHAPLSTEFSRKEYWSGLPCPLPGDLPSLGLIVLQLLTYISKCYNY